MKKPDIRAIEKRRKGKNVPEAEYLTQMDSPENAVEFRDLQVCFFTDAGVVRAADGVTFDIPQGKIVGVVGESGCGKSVTSLSLMQLLQRPQGQITGGQIRLNLGQKAYDIAQMPEGAMIPLRGKELAMIFQEPMTALNPVFSIGKQVGEMLLLHQPEKPVKHRVLELLSMVGIPDPERVYGRYPHELSGGMRQRVMIAMAIACDPRVIIADEPTTALDVTIQAQILEILKELKNKTGCSILLITHDLGVVAGMADFVVVMYAGRVVERGTAEEIFYQPAHPYTIGLMASKPVVGKKADRLYSIPGRVPNPAELPKHCYFKERCPDVGEACHGEYPTMIQLSPTHYVSCYRREETDDTGRGP